MLNKILLSFISVALTSLTGCAGISPDSHAPVTSVSSFVLDSPFSYAADRSFGIKLEFIIQAGKYTSSRQDSHGVYFIGPKDCLAEKVLNPGSSLKDSIRGKIRFLADCGIFVPNDNAQDPRIFMILGTGKYSETGFAQPTTDNNSFVTIAANTAMTSSAPPIQAGLAAGLGVGIVSALASAENGKFSFLENPPTGFRQQIKK